MRLFRRYKGRHRIGGHPRLASGIDYGWLDSIHGALNPIRSALEGIDRAENPWWKMWEEYVERESKPDRLAALAERYKKLLIKIEEGREK